MRKTLRKTIQRDPVRAARVKTVAELLGVSKRQVYRVIDGEQKNDLILETYMQINEGENLLLTAVKQSLEMQGFGPKN